MSEILGFDPKTLSDDQLFTKQIELARRKALVTRIGYSDAANQLETLIQAIEYERRERMFLDRIKQLPSSPILVETDPQMREQTAEDEMKVQTPTKPSQPVRRPIRTAKPVLPDGEQ